MAEISSDSAVSIDRLLKVVYDKTLITYESVDEVNQRIYDGRQKVLSVYDQFVDISSKMKNIFNVVESTSANIQEQTASNEQISSIVDLIALTILDMQEKMLVASNEISNQTHETELIQSGLKKILQNCHIHMLIYLQ